MCFQKVKLDLPSLLLYPRNKTGFGNILSKGDTVPRHSVTTDYTSTPEFLKRVKCRPKALSPIQPKLKEVSLCRKVRLCVCKLGSVCVSYAVCV